MPFPLQVLRERRLASQVRKWAKDIPKNPQMLVDAAFDASKATDYICDRERQRERTAQPQEKTQKESLLVL